MNLLAELFWMFFFPFHACIILFFVFCWGRLISLTFAFFIDLSIKSIGNYQLIDTVFVRLHSLGLKKSKEIMEFSFSGIFSLTQWLA